MTSRRLITALLAALALAAGGCGNAQKHLLSQTQANRLQATLDKARRAAEANHCNEARAYANRGVSQASALSSRVDRKLRANLVDGFNHLVDTINSDCGAKSTPTPTPTETPTDTPSPSPTASPSPSPTPSPSPSPTPTPTASPTATPTSDTGGTSGDGTSTNGTGG